MKKSRCMDVRRRLDKTFHPCWPLSHYVFLVGSMIFELLGFVGPFHQVLHPKIEGEDPYMNVSDVGHVGLALWHVYGLGRIRLYNGQLAKLINRVIQAMSDVATEATELLDDPGYKAYATFIPLIFAVVYSLQIGRSVSYLLLRFNAVPNHLVKPAVQVAAWWVVSATLSFLTSGMLRLRSKQVSADGLNRDPGQPVAIPRAPGRPPVTTTTTVAGGLQRWGEHVQAITHDYLHFDKQHQITERIALSFLMLISGISSGLQAAKYALGKEEDKGWQAVSVSFMVLEAILRFGVLMLAAYTGYKYASTAEPLYGPNP